jgi:hypothetical protein
MTDLRKLARGQACRLRLPGCLPGNETVVLAHLRIGGIAGVGQKPVDLAGLPACEHCHSQLDGRVKSPHSKAQIHADALRGLCQWLTWLHQNGHISH